MANGALAGIAGGFDGLMKFLQFREQKRLADAEEARRNAETERLNANADVQRRAGETQLELAKMQLAQQPMLNARNTLQSNIAVKGLEATLNDPATLELGKTAGITFDTKPRALPEFFLGGHVADSAYGPIHASSQEVADAYNRKAGIYSNTGIVKPPQVLQAEQDRALAMQRAATIQNWMNSANQSGGGSIGEDTPQNRVMMRLGLGVNPNEMWGSPKETPQEAAARAVEVAKALAPFRKELLDYGVGLRDDVAGDPYFNEALRTLTGIIPPVNERTQQIVVEGARGIAEKAQGVRPRGRPSPARPTQGAGAPAPSAAPSSGPPAQTPGGGPPSIDIVVQQSLQKFGSLEALAAEAAKPEVQQRMKAIGIDPVAFARRIQAMQIASRLGGQK